MSQAPRLVPASPCWSRCGLCLLCSGPSQYRAEGNTPWLYEPSHKSLGGSGPSKTWEPLRCSPCSQIALQGQRHPWRFLRKAGIVGGSGCVAVRESFTLCDPVVSALGGFCKRGHPEITELNCSVGRKDFLFEPNSAVSNQVRGSGKGT